jgi:amylosucrase
MDDLSELAAALRGRGMSLCVDLVLNHTAREHPWARAWLAGDEEHAASTCPSPTARCPTPTRHHRRRVPRPGPGSFTRVPGAGWVWTTFFDYQWDLDWTNPRVFTAMLDTILWLADRGVEISGSTPCRSWASGWAPPA